MHFHLQVSADGNQPKLHVVTSRPGYAGPADHLEISGNQLKFKISTEEISFTGTIASDTIIGAWSEGESNSWWLTMHAVATPAFMFTQQHPMPPLPYLVEEITVPGSMTRPHLAGTMTRPAGPGSFPVILLLNGQGAQGRDSENHFHRPFLIWADYLTRKGFAVLRCDDRGVGLSGGTFKTATTADFAIDARACLDFLKTRNEVDQSRMGILGHSEGALVAAMVASDCHDVSFLVLLAPPVFSRKITSMQQSESINRRKGADERQARLRAEFLEEAYRILETNPETDAGKDAFRKYYLAFLSALTEEDRRVLGFPAGDKGQAGIEKALQEWCSPWCFFMAKFDPADSHKGITCPVLAVFAGFDESVLPGPNTARLATLLRSGQCPDFKIHVFPDFDHQMRRPIVHASASYPLAETVSTEALDLVVSWIRSQLPE
ncbi:MAG TPA: alpha/beta hydrolase [Candidatus Ozemobacteraceae bacterium]|nr:alpha/beta hydrolase [Candidatus Ozemobacteraceae bacterium]